MKGVRPHKQLLQISPSSPKRLHFVGGFGGYESGFGGLDDLNAKLSGAESEIGSTTKRKSANSKGAR